MKMNRYLIRGLYTISFEKEIEARNREEAEEMAEDIYIQTEHNGSSVFVDDDTQLEADGTPFDISVELIEGEEKGEDEEDD
jgi:hypothetical protein